MSNAAIIDVTSLAVHESLYSPMHIYSANLLYIPCFAPFVGVHIFTEHYFPLVILLNVFINVFGAVLCIGLPHLWILSNHTLFSAGLPMAEIESI